MTTPYKCDFCGKKLKLQHSVGELNWTPGLLGEDIRKAHPQYRKEEDQEQRRSYNEIHSLLKKAQKRGLYKLTTDKTFHGFSDFKREYIPTFSKNPKYIINAYNVRLDTPISYKRDEQIKLLRKILR